MDKQINDLAKKMAEEGIAPPRDLWPEIEQAMDQAGQEKKPRRTFDPNAWYRLAAVAATLILLVGAGYFGGNPQQQPQGEKVAVLVEDNPSLLQRLNNTISELDKAMALDPENIKLTRLSLMTHKSRANLLRVETRR